MKVTKNDNGSYQVKEFANTETEDGTIVKSLISSVCYTQEMIIELKALCDGDIIKLQSQSDYYQKILNKISSLI